MFFTPTCLTTIKMFFRTQTGSSVTLYKEPFGTLICKGVFYTRSTELSTLWWFPSSDTPIKPENELDELNQVCLSREPNWESSRTDSSCSLLHYPLVTAGPRAAVAPEGHRLNALHCYSNSVFIHSLLCSLQSAQLSERSQLQK